jgi:hypothetical protein
MQGFNLELTLPRAQLVRGYQSQAALLYNVGGGSYWVACMVENIANENEAGRCPFQNNPLAPSLRNVKAALASQKSEGFLRALRADIKEILAWISLTGSHMPWSGLGGSRSLLCDIHECRRHFCSTNEFFCFEIFLHQWILTQTILTPGLILAIMTMTAVLILL